MGPREFYETLPSTQERAVALARAGASDGTRVVARRQSWGRGRLERRWESPLGGFYGSIILPRPKEHTGLLPLTVGARLASDLHGRFGLRLAVRWPNDLLVTEAGRPARKLAGILIDEVPAPERGLAVVIGVGVNVRFPAGSIPPGLTGRVAALDEFVDTSPTLDEVEGIVMSAATGAVGQLSQSDGVTAARALCRQLLYGVGRPVTVDGLSAGTLAALGDEGELWVTHGTNRVAIWAGDVRVVDSA